MCAPGSDLGGAEIVFGELVTNALRYSGTGATAEVLCHGDRITLEIEDGGAGFDAESVAGRARRPDESGGSRSRGDSRGRSASTSVRTAAPSGRTCR
jgi:signal transduction histidine kinase